MTQHNVEFVKSGRGKAQCEPDPAYPDGLVVDMRAAFPPEQPTCAVDLPYPAPECGFWNVECMKCKISVVLTAAGRPDDPRQVFLPCLPATNRMVATFMPEEGRTKGVVFRPYVPGQPET